MVKSKNKAILIRMTDDLYHRIEKQVSELDYSSMAEYSRDAIEKFIKENIEGGEYLTFGDVQGTFEEFALVLKGIVSDVDRMKKELNTLMFFDTIAEILKRLERIESVLGIEGNR